MKHGEYFILDDRNKDVPGEWKDTEYILPPI